MLPKLVSERMKDLGLSNRAAAKKIGIAHTTLERFQDGRDIDLETLIKICGFFEIPLSTAVNSLQEENSLAGDVAVLIESQPGLADRFKEAIANFKSNGLSAADLVEIIEFIIFKLRTKQK